MNFENVQIPENSDEFFPWLKENSEKLWEDAEIKKGIFGFQIQKGTKWLAGLSESEIDKYESELGFAFPEVYKNYLRNINGTDKPAINVYGYSETVAYAPAFYSFPRDLDIVKDRIRWIYEEFKVNEKIVSRDRIPHIIPIVGHRFLIAENCQNNPILSMQGTDSILYAPTLESFLVADIFHNSLYIGNNSGIEVNFWLQYDN